ncbi:MAG: hypothetical protein N2645_19535 [Clostridia bacterium]|nr:hypothetical protein [Clostridia bacterium]
MKTVNLSELFKSIELKDFGFVPDNAVNMTDIMILINHFNKASVDYPLQ